MDIFLWILQVILAPVYAASGIVKATDSKGMLEERAREHMARVDSISDQNIKISSVIQILAAIGLILPLATGVLSWLTPLASVGLVLTMIGAIILYIKRSDGIQPFTINTVLLKLATFVNYQRFAI